MPWQFISFSLMFIVAFLIRRLLQHREVLRTVLQVLNNHEEFIEVLLAEVSLRRAVLKAIKEGHIKPCDLVDEKQDPEEEILSKLLRRE